MSTTPPTDRFGRFVLLDEAGAGAMGTVYAAYDPQLDRRVALKVLHSRHATHQERIRREAVAMARVSHPNVAQIYEVGEHEGQLFIAMEFVDGQTLTDWQRGIDDWGALVRLYIAVGRGLAAAHEAGLVHRDFKPDNVLVGADGRPRVIDFGLARAPNEAVEVSGEPIDDTLDGGALLASPLTRTGHLLGTPAYMAPEQLAGQPPTAACDQFAFAVTLYEALYDQAPFPRDSMRSLRRAASKGLVEPPPADRVVKPVHNALIRALAPDPEARWPDMQALLATLQAHVANDEHRDRRARLKMGAVLIVLVFGALSLMRTVAPPRTAMDLLLGESFILLGMIIGVRGFVRRMAPTHLHRQISAWVLLIGASKVAGALVGVAFDQPPAVVHAFDTVSIALMCGVATFLVRRVLWPMAAIGLLAVLGIAVWPRAAFMMHDLSILGLALTALAFTAGLLETSGHDTDT